MNDAGRQIDERGPAPRRDALPLAQLLATIARASETNETLTGVIRDALAAICSWSQWPVGHFYWFDEDEASINPSGVWTHSESPGFVAFHAASDGLDLHSERGLPGRVAAANGPIRLEDVRHDDRFLRRQEAAEAGLRGALAFPVSDGDRLLGVAEFFSFRPLTLDPELLELSGHIGARLGGQIASWQANAALQASEERFRSLANAANDAIIAADSTDRIIFWNKGAERLFGYSEQEALGQPTAIIVPQDYLEDHNAGIQRIVHHGMKAARVIGVKSGENVHGLRRNGQRFPLEMSLGTWTTDGERFFISVLRDTTERTEANQRRLLLFEDAPDAMFEIDERGEILQANAQAETLLGRPRSQLLGMSVERLATSADRHVVARSFHEVLNLLESGTSASEVDRIEVHTDEPSLPVEITFRALHGVYGPVVLAVARDISERRRLEAAQHLADHDPLTGLFNRRRFEAELARHVQHAHRYGAGALLFVDLDGFKAVNDTCGHQTGDELLQAVASTIVARLRRTDVVARLGGDEFAALLPDTDAQHAQIVAEDVLIAVREVAERFAEHAPRVSASIGISCFDATIDDEEDLLTAADLAMYSAKRNGGNRIHMFDPSSREDQGESRSWIERLERALEDDAFVLHCQPIVSIATREVCTYELLLRLPGEGGQLFPPAAFMGAAERHGLIRQVDRWVSAKAIELIAARNALGHELNVAVNLSALTVGDDGLLTFIGDQLDRTGVSPSSLVFEITETAALANMQAVREFVIRMKEVGCRFSLDDFGAGFSSFAALKHLPVDYLKIDGAFVRGLVHSRADRLVVRALVDIARGLGMRTVGEHVEDRPTEAVLRECGVDFAQGYLFSRPLPIDRMLGVVTG